MSDLLRSPIGSYPLVDRVSSEREEIKRRKKEKERIRRVKMRNEEELEEEGRGCAKN